ncbi:hypothetical protein DI09_40p120 [Mitosporidium daphniae]|uniref:Cytochrome b5 heme-binding domain-containing protein n=1 Tax=Mitosporidium daphniae TaxID=1485682 RepID=A0A098VU43_9MICR|nr:uncharacterized protein DI09_40p120 [Mitosporidium daphniae]KGG51226.1 hypothetical protein DI09_40p120 [Mitosporidium daphniae]|eukprot:XP_013237653.1 uncharacterized protein DI09_40p120 [Mitosporidium daphniae]
MDLRLWLTSSSVSARKDRFDVPIPISTFRRNKLEGESLLVTFDGHIVYDLSEFCKYHPGGIAILENSKGTDILEAFRCVAGILVPDS